MSIEIAQKYGLGVTYKGDDGGLYFKDEAGNVTSLTQPDQLVKVSSNDTTAAYLEGKLVAGSNVTLTTNNDGGNETITIAAAADNDEKTKVSSNDTTSGYLDGKLVAGSGITLTQNNDGGNETLTITANVADTNDKARVSANDTTPGYLNGKLVAGANVTFTEGNDGGDETLTIAAAGGVTGFTASQNDTSPNNTVNASRLLVDATSTNADAVIQPKGTGAILAQLPDGAVSGGNKRGANAVDLQTSRTSSSQVASGLNSAVIGGTRNTATGSQAAAVGGTANTASGSDSFVTGVLSTASGNYSFAFGASSNATGAYAMAGCSGLGATNTASGEGSVALGMQNTSSSTNSFALGANNTAASTYAFATGHRAHSTNYGQFTHSTGVFGSLGTCQYERYILGRATTDATETELSCSQSAPGVGNRISIASDATYTFRAMVTARRTDADNESAGWEVVGVIDNNAGTTALVGSVTVTAIGDDSAGTWTVSVTADNTNDALVFKVTGEAGKTIRWGATVELMKVAG